MREDLRIDIRGMEVFDRLTKAARDTPGAIKKALRKVMFWAEDDIKKQHYPGHGKVTGTLQRSWYSEVPTEVMGRVGTTPGSMKTAGSRVFYAPFVNALYGFTIKTRNVLPKVIDKIFGTAADKLTKDITGGS